MHLLVLPFILAGLGAKIYNNRIKNNTPEKQIDIILSTFFTALTPQHFGEFYASDENKTVQSAQEGALKG
jgi:hypothetical protein